MAAASLTRAVVFAPYGRDSSLAASMLESAGLAVIVCSTSGEFVAALDESATFALVTLEALRQIDLEALSRALSAQPEWSDLAFIVLVQRAHSRNDPVVAALLQVVHNITFLERPFHPATFKSVVVTAANGRRRQFDARARIEELHESEQRLRTALLAGRLGSWELDIETLLLKASATCKAVFGRTAEDAFGYQDLLASVHPDDQERMRGAAMRTMEGRGDYQIEYRNVWPNGTVHWAEVRARLVRDQTGLFRMVGVSSDITDRKTGEERLRQLNETLEERVAVRTTELEAAHASVLEEIEQRRQTEEKLRQAQKMEAIGQLTGGVAHDFNNLLMAIMSNLDLLRKQIAGDERATKLLDGAIGGASRGAALTQRLLAFARQQALSVRPTRLADLIEGSRNLVERSIGASIELRVELPRDISLVMVDANQIELAILNLAVNARDAMPGGGTLTIAVDEREAPAGPEIAGGRYVRLVVSDTGHGMDAATLKKATEPFFSTKELGKGTGLGLSMVHGLATQLGGKLTIESDVGVGTRIELWMPATSEAAAPSVEVKESLDDVGPLTILVVDDDALIAMSTVAVVEDLGHRVFEANSGARALELLRDHDEIDLLLTDFSMPKMNGAELASAARKLRPGLPILVATGYADLPAGKELELPRISKPYGQDQLSQEIAKIMSASSG